jgi:hypothetical protein
MDSDLVVQLVDMKDKVMVYLMENQLVVDLVGKLVNLLGDRMVEMMVLKTVDSMVAVKVKLDEKMVEKSAGLKVEK